MNFLQRVTGLVGKEADPQQQQKEEGVSFPVCSSLSVGNLRSPLPPSAVRDAFERFAKVEALSLEGLSPSSLKGQPARRLVEVFSKNSVLARAVHLAFYEHLPLILSPDAIWITIAQGFANHVNMNAKKLRYRFVDHEGQKDITISRPEFIRGSPDNNWEGVFPEFSAKIKQATKENIADLIRCEFSTTTPTSRICSEIVLMESVKSYFRFVIVCGCGIPSITLRGTVADWQEVRRRAEGLLKVCPDLDWWISELILVLDQFVAAAEGRGDKRFWASVCNVFGGSGFRSPLSGWVQVFYPYLLSGGKTGRGWGFREDSEPSSDLEKNAYLGEWRKCFESGKAPNMSSGSMFSFDEHEKGSCGMGVKLERIPSSLSFVPFKYVDLLDGGRQIDYRFYGGLTHVVQRETDTAVEPLWGWAVAEN
uniref:Uncharacterized protein n=1 Tax=Chromera velia CCMP2878 TaxID=1169474 RepID=A0A0G4IAL1_9ALVE|eukprot:Cvel_12487.t1-p1 / transcript=Cvel_12487.t1 / gene=Cvel_12487 / organism=Chromera_velia_CCMP2878 / gene_product=Uncharacterized protein L662, putative / transcript_product=Uncharacterized protein L662, putative / location=Cvel_scaffold819:13459-14721(-) / protein_length=421 / sequence_SO=supercontig / SO=protein_coding / is_pseudo=false